MRWETASLRQLVESPVNSAPGMALVAALVWTAERETRRSLVSWAAFAALNSVRESLEMSMMAVGRGRRPRRRAAEARLPGKCLLSDGMSGADLDGPRQPHNSSQLYPWAASFNQSIRGETVV